MTKNYFKQRVPGFIDPRGLVRSDFQFTKTEELLEHLYVQSWLKESEETAIFKKNNMIIVTTNKEDDIGFVIGYVKNPNDVELPVKND